jgi:hypothetical protein
MKLFEIIDDTPEGIRRYGRPQRPIYKYVIAPDLDLAQRVVANSIRYFKLKLTEEIPATTSNMIGVLYTRYLIEKDQEISNGDPIPRYFETVLNYSKDNVLVSSWNRFRHLTADDITLKDIINENRDREKVIELITDRINRRKKFMEEEAVRLVEFEKKLKNLEILPIND